MTAGRLPRPPRPLSLTARKQVLVQEVLEDAVADGLVAPSTVDGLGYILTPLGEAWLRDFPGDLLACYPERRAERA